MKARSILVLLVMFAVMAVPVMASDMAFYKFTNNVDDETGTYDATNNGATFTTAYPTMNISGDGSTHSADFDGVNDYVKTPQTVLTNMISADEFTISGWIRTTTGNKYIYSAGSGGTHLGIAIGFDVLTSGELRCFVGYSGSAPQAISTGTVDDGNWQHVACTYDGTTIKTYINGVQDGSVSAPSPVWGSTDTSYIARQGTKYFNGDMDEIHYYDKILDATNISNLYNYNDATGVPTVPEFNITAFDAETAVQINTFNVTLNATFFSTTNGTITHNVTGEYSTLVQANGYIPVTTTYTYSDGQTVQWNLTKVNRNITLYAGNNYGQALETFNVSVDGGAPLSASGYSITTEVDRTVLHNLTFTASGHKPFTFTGFNATSNTTYNATLTSNFVYVDFDATDENSTALTDFNLTVNGVTYAVATNKTFFLDSSELYNVTFAKANYFSDIHTNYNVTSNLTGNLTEYFRIVVGTETFVPGTSNTTAMAFYKFSNNANDETGTYNGTNNGADFLTRYPDMNISGDGSTHSAYFDGSDYINIPNTVLTNMINADAFSIGAWVRTNESGSNMRIIDGGTGGTFLGTAIDMYHRGTNNLPVCFVGYSGSAPQAFATTQINDGNWHHVACTYDGDLLRIYVDGVLEGTASAPTPTWSTGTTNIGALGSTTQRWTGDIDEVQIYNSTLNDTGIRNLYNYNTDQGEGGSSTVISNTTDQYSVNWNSTTYYPNAENKTYLPVRYTLENFTVNPFTAQFKQISKTNYNTTFHLTTTFNNSHQVTATNLYDGTSIANFTVETPTQNYTADGTIAYLQNDTGNITYTVSHPSYFDAVNAGVDVTNGSSSVTMYQAVVTFNGTQRFTNATVADGNVTLPDGYGGTTTKAFNEPFYLNAGTYTAQYSSVNDEADDQNFTVAVLDNTTVTISNITNANLTIIGTNAVDGTPIPFFTSSVSNDTLFISLNQTKTSPHLYNLIQNVTYNVVFDNTSFALGDVNLTLLNRSTLYNFTVYTTNSFNISILNELTKDEITDTNFTVEFIGSYASYNYTYENGNLYADLIVPDQYQIRYQWINTTSATDYGQLRQYHYILTNRTYNPLDLFAINKSESTEIEITVQNGNTLVREEGVIVKLQRFYIDTNSYETVAMYETDSQGKAHFDVEANNELYKFVIDSPLGTTVYTSTPQYLQETEYTIFIDTSDNPVASYTNNAGLTVTFTVTNTTATATYNDPSATADEYEFTVFERGPYTDTQVSTATATSTSGALINTYAFEEGKSYYGVLYRDSVAEATADFVDFEETNGLPALGLFLTSILFVVAVFVSAFSLYSVIIASIALVASNMIGLITISTPVIGAVVVGAIILAIILEWRRG